MRSKYLACLLLAGLAYGQAMPPAAPAAGAKAEQSAPTVANKTPEVKVAPDDAVITLKGFCANSALQGDACKTTITRAQLEKLAEALQPNMSLAIRRDLGTSYARMLKMNKAAEKRGLDKGPRFEEVMFFARMQILSRELTKALQEDAAKVSDEDIEAYYKKNELSYEQATFARIFIPRTKQIVNHSPTPNETAKPGATPAANPAPTPEQQKAAEETMTKVADDIRTRAVKGEDPDALEKEVYADAGLPGSPMSTKMEKVRRTTLPANHLVVMDLKPGDVSVVISDPSGGHYIYKMISKETLPLDAVKAEIRNTISSQRYRDSMQEFQGNVELNDAYFGPSKPAIPPRQRGMRPTDQPVADPD
jgi:bifunctional DNA-binding transcriptional regulator/antitoxin component of YhaV-PrlF toxin-antitoxin module